MSVWRTSDNLMFHIFFMKNHALNTFVHSNVFVIWTINITSIFSASYIAFLIDNNFLSLHKTLHWFVTKCIRKIKSPKICMIKCKKSFLQHQAHIIFGRQHDNKVSFEKCRCFHYSSIKCTKRKFQHHLLHFVHTSYTLNLNIWIFYPKMYFFFFCE